MGRMAPQQKAALRPMTGDEHIILERMARAQNERVDRVRRAHALLAVAQGAPFRAGSPSRLPISAANPCWRASTCWSSSDAEPDAPSPDGKRTILIDEGARFRPSLSLHKEGSNIEILFPRSDN